MIALFETDHRNIERYYLVHKLIKIEFVNKNALLVLESKREALKSKKLYPNTKVTTLSKLNFSQVSHLIINGNRIPDIYISLVAKKKRIPISYIQHGPHSIMMIRSIRFYISNLIKTARYFKYCLKILYDTKSIKLFLLLIKKNTLGGSRHNSLLKEYSPDYSFIYSKYYKDWHIKNYFGTYPKYIFLKNRDSLLKPLKLKNTMVFCYQTLLEDGRYDEIFFYKILGKIKLFGDSLGLKPVVKTHPRMSSYNKKKLKSLGWEMFESDANLPIGNFTVGFYSSLLSLWSYYKSPVVSIKLENHFSPPEISLYSNVCNINNLSIRQISISKTLLKERSKKTDYLFNFSGGDGFYIHD